MYNKFNLSLTQLEEMVSILSDDIQKKILDQPKNFLEMLDSALAEPEEFLWLVDKNQALSSEYAPADLVDIDFYEIPGTRKGMKLRKIIISPLLSLFQSASQAGHKLVVGSAYRSYQDQERIYQHWVNLLGQEQADRESAHPGHSQHQLGTTLDFSPIEKSFADLPEGRWLLDNAWKFGFSLSYPKGMEAKTGYIYEPWHFRYMGMAAASIVEEYFGSNQQLFLEFYQLNADFLQSCWLN